MTDNQQAKSLPKRGVRCFISISKVVWNADVPTEETNATAFTDAELAAEREEWIRIGFEAAREQVHYNLYDPTGCYEMGLRDKYITFKQFLTAQKGKG